MEDREVGENEIDREEKRISQLWQSVVNARTEEEYETHLWNLRDTAPAELVRYINRQWIPHAKRFVTCWADKHQHLGQKASSRVEGAHSKLKRDPSLGGSSRRGILALVEACIAVAEDYREKLKLALGVDRSHITRKWQQEPFFGDIVRKVSGKALDLVSETFDLVIQRLEEN